MNIKTKSLTEKAIKENDDRDEYNIEVNNKIRISANDYGAPEDNFLGRDLKFVYKIIPLMKEAYDAGKNGEKFEIVEEKLTLEDLEDN